MAKKCWLKQALAIFAILLFTADTTSDTYVGIDLYSNRCHYRYAGSVLSFVAVPGFLSGWLMLEKVILRDLGFEFHGCEKIGIRILGTLIGPIIFIPCVLYQLVKVVRNIDDSDEMKFAKA